MSRPAEEMRVQIRRRMPAPRNVVYEAWTNPEGIRHWMCPGDVVSAEATLDVRVGGTFRIVMKSKTAEHVHTGTYQVVEPPAKLVFTWTASNHTPTLVTLEFLDRGEESELVLTHERFTAGDVAKRYEGGWGTIAEKFAAYLAGNRKK
jgi:uncharacterized protein YndB with AHSA1/START domain